MEGEGVEHSCAVKNTTVFKTVAIPIRRTLQVKTGVLGFEPRPTVLETGMLPLHHTPRLLNILDLMSLSTN